MPKVMCFIQARKNSTRFPGKIFADLGGRTVIRRVWEQAVKIRGLSEEPVILYPEDFPQREENDVLGRYADASRDHKADVVIRVTGDCPFFDPQVGTECLNWFMAWPRNYDYVSNVFPTRTFPDGLDCEVFTSQLLYQFDGGATDPKDREHVTCAMQRWDRLRYYNVKLPIDWSHIRLTVDEPRDLEFMRAIIRYVEKP